MPRTLGVPGVPRVPGGCPHSPRHPSEPRLHPAPRSPALPSCLLLTKMHRGRRCRAGHPQRPQSGGAEALARIAPGGAVEHRGGHRPRQDKATVTATPRLLSALGRLGSKGGAQSQALRTQPGRTPLGTPPALWPLDPRPLLGPWCSMLLTAPLSPVEPGTGMPQPLSLRRVPRETALCHWAEPHGPLFAQTFSSFIFYWSEIRSGCFLQGCLQTRQFLSALSSS